MRLGPRRHRPGAVRARPSRVLHAENGALTPSQRRAAASVARRARDEYTYGMLDSTSVWISGGSLLISAIALWRSGRVRVLDRRTELRKDLADLWPRLGGLKAVIRAASTPRTHAMAAVGLVRSEQELLAAPDADAVKVLRALIDEIGRIPWFATSGKIEAKIVAARTVRTRFELLADKYAECHARPRALVSTSANR